MANSNKKQSGGFISNAFGMAKKLSETGLSVINHVAPGTVSKLSHSPKIESVVQGTAQEKSAFERKQYENPQQMLREHLPNVTGQLLGKHYKKINNVASFISPDLNDKLSDFIFDKLNEFVSELTSVEAVLKEVGAKSLAELAKDSERSQRISTALANQNKIIAAIQGTVTGAFGGLGAILDVPSSLALALRSVYHTGRAHGFELNAKDHAVVEYIFKQIDLGTVAEKHALMAAIRTFAGVLQTHNVSQLQQLLGSSNDIELLKKWVANEDGTFKLPWMNNLPHFSLLTRLTPLATMGISAAYSWKLVDDATDKAQIVFSGARQYLLQHSDEKIDVLDAYEKFSQLISDAHPLLLEDSKAETLVEKVEPQVENEAITHVEVKEKTSETVDELNAEQKVEQGIQKLAETHIEDKHATQQQDKATPVKPRRTAQKKVAAVETTTAKATDVAKTSTTAKTVTKKRTPAKAKAAPENTVNASEKTQEATETKSESKPE
ncbi:EcsC family protein [Acinetobacter guillouiae]|uniref:EcsC family protein n=1 Tax=Acinetobacter guillouiae TaxID=106649 RepID=UPI0026E20D31|nr:EcsC family protein [Acinetobacter guillouiae]MDO6646315.1 EcsC family protein [Acinetobacter guillouiae]